MHKTPLLKVSQGGLARPLHIAEQSSLVYWGLLGLITNTQHDCQFLTKSYTLLNKGCLLQLIVPLRTLNESFTS